VEVAVLSTLEWWDFRMLNIFSSMISNRLHAFIYMYIRQRKQYVPAPGTIDGP